MGIIFGVPVGRFLRQDRGLSIGDGIHIGPYVGPLADRDLRLIVLGRFDFPEAMLATEHSAGIQAENLAQQRLLRSRRAPYWRMNELTTPRKPDSLDVINAP
jgi:hypothetical protein